MLRIYQGNEGNNYLIGHEKSTSGFRKKSRSITKGNTLEK